MRKFRDWLTHLIGMAGQVVAALPQVLITVFLARRGQLESAGLFAVATGLAAAAFTVASWGFVPHMVLERMRQFSASTYVLARATAIVVVGTITLVLGLALFPAIGLGLLLAVVVLRAADTLLELQFGFLQIQTAADRAILFHAGLQAGKLLLMTAVMAASSLWPAATPDRVILIGTATALAGAVAALLVQYRKGMRGEATPAGMRKLFIQASWFGLAVVLCAIVTNLPRLSLPYAYDGERLGVAGVALTIATFFGMAFYTSWIRHYPRLAQEHDPSRAVAFLLELGMLAALCAMAAVWPLPWLAAWLFAFDLDLFRDDVRAILLASVVFFAGMGLANLYKLRWRPWSEALVYFAALIAALALGYALLPLGGLAPSMLLIGALMAALSVPALRAALVQGSGRG